MSDKKNRVHQIAVLTEQAGQRLDRFLASLEFIPSRSRAAELIDQGLITLRGRALKASYVVRARDELQVALPEPQRQPPGLLPLDAPLERLYEDADLVVINKPAGLVVHPAAGHAQDTLVNILLHHVRQLSMGFAENRPGIVHRLDRDTSGILVVAKNDLTHHGLAEQFRARTTRRIYWAVVFGVPNPGSGTIKSHLARHPQDRKRFSSQTNGKFAVTHFKVLQKNPASSMSWLECKLETGRTHQIRVHLSEAGHPIVGDKVYGNQAKARSVNKELRSIIPDLQRIALHACELGFTHPRSQEEMFFRLPWPDDLRTLLTTAGFKDV